MDAEKSVREKWRLLKATMNERARRLWAGAEAAAIWYGGVVAVARATGMAISTVRKGRDEARAGARPDDQRQGKGRQGEPELVDVHDFSSDAVGKAVPYGVYDIAANDGFVSVGIDHDTPVFALTSIEAWWKKVGLQRYPGVGGHQIPRPLGEDRGGVISPVHHSPVKIWAGGLRAA